MTTPDRPAGNPSEAVGWGGLNHIALATADLDATVRFYHGVLGMPLMAAYPGGPSHGRHVLFACGNHTALHYFEHRDRRADPAPVAPVVHLAFSVPDEPSMDALRARLETEGIEVTPIISEGGGTFKRFMFTDNNGVRMEATWAPPWPNPDEAPDQRLFSDPQPVAAVTELLRDGRLHQPWRRRAVSHD